MKITIFGKGILGIAFSEVFPEAEIFSHQDLDICDFFEVRKKLKESKPEILINCAAYTKVDDAEIQKEKALNVNAEAVKNIAEICKKESIKLMHFSTDYVFSGSKNQDLKEDEKTNPINFYGETKLLGEKYLMKTNPDFWLIRTSSLFGEGGKNFVDTMIKLSKERTELKIVDDQVMSPTYSVDLAKVCKKITEENKSFGVYHITNSGQCTWAEFAEQIFKNLESEIKIKKVKSSEFKTLAKRPKYSVLRNTKLKNLRAWQESLNSYLELKKKI